MSFLLVAGILFGTTVNVAPGESIARAVLSLRETSGEKVVSLLPGVHRLAETLFLDDRDSGLVLKSSERGRAILSGAVLVEGWKKEPDGCLAADVPQTNGCPVDVRALIVNGRLAARAVYPGGGRRLEHLGEWPYDLRNDLKQPWERMPTRKELTEMPYDPKDIPRKMDVLNADVRLYHMWSESLLAVVSNDVKRHVLVLAEPASWPMGACGRRQYEICNVREGLTEPGMWCHDRRGGKIVYRPLPGETAASVRADVPVLARLVHVAGCGARGHARDIRLEGLVVEGAATSAASARFGGAGLPEAIRFFFNSDCSLVDTEIRNVGAVGFFCDGSCVRPRVRGCHVHHTGSTGVQFAGIEGLMEKSHVSHVGLLYPSAAAVGFGGTRTILRGCEIDHAPYCGVCGGGSGLLVEDNYVHHAMQKLQDGAGIYLGQVRDSVVRGNLVSDVVPCGSGFGVSAFYFDQNSVDCVLERNVSLGVARPTHNNVTRGIRVRDNAFFAPDDMTISFQESKNGTFERNLLCFRGKMDVITREAVDVWTNNVVCDSVPFADWRPEGSVQGASAWHNGDRTGYFPRWTRPDGRKAGLIWTTGKTALRDVPMRGDSVQVFGVDGKPVRVTAKGKGVYQFEVSPSPVCFVERTPSGKK